MRPYLQIGAKTHRLNRRAVRQFIDSIASVEGGLKSNSKKKDTRSTASHDTFIVGNDIFDRCFILFFDA